MSGPAASAIDALATAEALRSQVESSAAARWNDAAFRAFQHRCLGVLRSEDQRFGAALDVLNADLSRALALIG